MIKLLDELRRPNPHIGINALRWRTCNEVTIAASPVVFLPADLRDIKDGHLDSNKVEAGQVVEIYLTTLYHESREVDGGFNRMVTLPGGAGYPFEAVGGKKDPALQGGESHWKAGVLC
jgi:hypothetical protein